MSQHNGILENMTIAQVKELQPEVVVIGIGSTEPHGPHLPYGTDFFAVDGICRKAVPLANKRGGRVLLFPVLPIGNNVNFKAFPFACRVRVRTLMRMILDIIEALEEDGIRKIVLVNGHGGNTNTLTAVLREHFDRFNKDNQEKRAFVFMVSPTTFMPEKVRTRLTHSSPHGGEYEVALMLHLKPELVQTGKLSDFPMKKPSSNFIAENESKLNFVKPWHLFLPESAGGETRETTSELGKDVVESSIEGFADFLAEFSKDQWRPNYPYTEEK